MNLDDMGLKKTTLRAMKKLGWVTDGDVVDAVRVARLTILKAVQIDAVLNEGCSMETWLLAFRGIGSVAVDDFCSKFSMRKT